MAGKSKVTRRCAILLLAASAAVSLPRVGRADNVSWNPAVSDGSWNTPSNWLGGVVPGSNASANVVFNDALNHSITYDGNYSNPKFASGTFTLSNQGTGVANLSISDGSTLTAGWIQVGGSGNASVNQTGGTVSGLLSLAGGSTTSTATYTMSGGTLSASPIVGNLGSATFIQSGGTVLSADPGDGLWVGSNNGGTGHYEMSGGTIISNADDLIGWPDWTSSFTQTGGTYINTGTNIGLGVGRFPGGPPPVGYTGSYFLEDGTLITSREEVFVHGLVQSGGFHSTDGVLGGYGLTGGMLNVAYAQYGGNIQSGGTYNLGSTGTPGFLAGDIHGSPTAYILSGGVMNVIGTESFGGSQYNAGSAGTFTQSGGTHLLGTDASLSTLYLGYGNGQKGTYSLGGNGVFNAIGTEFVGYAGAGSFTQSAGTHTLGTTLTPSQLYLGFSSGSRGRYRQTGGEFDAIGTEYVGYDGAGTIQQSGGVHSLTGNMYLGGSSLSASATGFASLSVTGGTLSISGTLKVWNNATASFGGGTLNAGALDINGGLFKMTAGKATALQTGSITTSGGGKLDLADNSIIVNYPDGGPSSETSIASQIQSGYASGAWNGPGINSSIAAVDPRRRIGYADNSELGLSTFAGDPVDASSVLATLTYGGDANLDGIVNVSDLRSLATHWMQSGDWTQGDFDYNGFVDISDLKILAENWQAGSASLTSMETSLGLPLVDVPEPAMVGLIAIAISWSLKRPHRSVLRSRGSNTNWR